MGSHDLDHQRRWHRHDRVPVGEGEQRHLFADEPFLEHDATAGRRTGAGERVGDRSDRHVAAIGQHHALAGGQAIGLDDNGRAERVDPCRRLRHRRHDGGARTGDPVPLAERPRERLRPLQLGGGARRSERGYAGNIEHVDEPRRQRHLGPDDHQPDVLLDGEAGQALDIIGGDGDLLARTPTIARRDDQPSTARRACHRPGDGMLTPTRADDEHINDAGHRKTPSNAPLLAWRPTSIG